MKNSGRYLDRMSKARSRSVTAVLTFAVTLVAVALATPSAQAQTFTLLYSFQGPPLDGLNPSAELVFDQAGNLYGTTGHGGSTGYAGTVFKLDASGIETMLHSFAGTPGDGSSPAGQLVRRAGNIFGVTAGGGVNTCRACAGYGTIFEISHSTETILYSFTTSEGNLPQGLVSDSSGTLYGATAYGGIGTSPPACDTRGCGAVFQFSEGKETVLYSFAGYPDGQTPNGKLLVDASGNLYGTTQAGGAFNMGTVFILSPNSDGSWTEKLLYSFRGRSDGRLPLGGLIMDSKGSLYGTTSIGGLSVKLTNCANGCGVVFKLVQNPDGTWSERALYKFRTNPDDGTFPTGILVRDRHGNLFGTTSFGGGPTSAGTVFEVDSAGTEKVLHNFVGGTADGTEPAAGLVTDADGNLYGTTQWGGSGTGCAGGCGTVFKITP